MYITLSVDEQVAQRARDAAKKDWQKPESSCT